MNVHPSITIDQMPVVGLTIFQFDQLLQSTITSSCESLTITQYLEAVYSINPCPFTTNNIFNILMKLLPLGALGHSSVEKVEAVTQKRKKKVISKN